MSRSKPSQGAAHTPLNGTQQSSNDGTLPSSSGIRAAQYLRMSTEHQRYSLENQSSAIRDYARDHHFTVTKTYSDAARSGLTLRKRSGLRALLHDVLSQDPGFDVILVYDVSRWGRFQDIDESATYEFLCRRSGHSVHYCAEPFPNDGSVSSSLLKSLKRAMAGEFSRELGERAHQAKKQTALQGYWAAGRSAFGLRRRIVSPLGKRDRDLEVGEHKNLRIDRIQLVPGAAEEVGCVREIYELAISGLGPSEIARELPRKGYLFRGRRWNLGTIKNILTNPIYAGEHIWGKRSQRLGEPLIITPEHTWTRSRMPSSAVIDKKVFNQVQTILRRKAILRTWSKERILTRVRALLTKEGRLSEMLMQKASGMPASHTIRAHFGSYRRLYETVGYKPQRRWMRMADAARNTIQLREELVTRLETMFPARLTVVRKHSAESPKFRIDGKLVVSLMICRSVRTPRGNIRWNMPPVSSTGPVLLCKLDAANSSVEGFHLLPHLELRRYHRLKEQDSVMSNGWRLQDLSQLCELASRI